MNKLTQTFLALIFLSSCAILPGVDEQGYTWVPLTMSHVIPKENWRYYYVDDIVEYCGPKTYGCATMRYGRFSSCEIYLPKNPPEWLVKHEERHCLGWIHDKNSPRRGNFDIPERTPIQ